MRTAELTAAFEVLLASTNPNNRVDVPHTRHTISRKATGAGVHRSDAYAASKVSGGKDKRVGAVEIDFNLLAPLGKPVTQEDQAGRDETAKPPITT
jgi:hypothetical protein